MRRKPDTDMETRANPKALKSKPGQPTHTKREEKKMIMSYGEFES